MNDLNRPLVTHLPRTPITKQPAWLNKDRFWNLVFATIMTAGMFIVSILPDAKSNSWSLSSILSWLTLIGTPLLIKYFNKVSFVEDTKFLTSEGREINVDTDFPNWFIFITIAFIMVLGFVIDKNRQNLPVFFSNIILIGSIFFIPALCFSYKNCPISILFNLKFWRIESGNNNMPYNSYDYKSSSQSYSDRYRYDTITNPVYSSLSNNIYHRNR